MMLALLPCLDPNCGISWVCLHLLLAQLLCVCVCVFAIQIQRRTQTQTRTHTLTGALPLFQDRSAALSISSPTPVWSLPHSSTHFQGSQSPAVPLQGPLHRGHQRRALLKRNTGAWPALPPAEETRGGTEAPDSLTGHSHTKGRDAGRGPVATGTTSCGSRGSLPLNAAGKRRPQPVGCPDTPQRPHHRNVAAPDCRKAEGSGLDRDPTPHKMERPATLGNSCWGAEACLGV